MCGLAGLINYRNPQHLIEKVVSSMDHRGPDARGVWSGGCVALGHNRLTIIDLSERANQPFEKDGLVIAYNGEVYNYPELKKDLESSGVRFRTNSDTEVVLEMFRKYREDSFTKLRGMFAFAIYDLKSSELYLARDCFGIKPLYYFHENEKFAFASEIKAFQELENFKKEINIKALISSLNYLWIYGDQSIFKGVEQLPPAHFMRIGKNADIKVRRYWKLEPEKYNFTELEYVQKLREMLRDSVKKHLISDVPVGSFLSGGLDSSYITAAAKKFNPDITSYTISISDEDKKTERMPDDNRYAAELARKLSINHSDIPVSPDIVHMLDNIVSFMDEPIGDPAAINTYLICREARKKGIKVLLSGMGADEIFGGYRRHKALLYAMRYNRLPDIFKKTMTGISGALPVRIGNRGILISRWLKRFLSFTGMNAAQAYMRSYSYYSRDELYSLFNNQFNKLIDRMYEEHEDIFNSGYSGDIINRMCFTDIKMFMRGLNLTYTDRASMASSVEVRVPFIDKDLIEFAMAIPGSLKIKRGQSKYALKKAAETMLPRNIVYRPKASFGMPIRAWVSGKLTPMMDGYLNRGTISRRGYLNPDMVGDILQADRKGIEDNAYRIYQLLTLETWFRKYMD